MYHKTSHVAKHLCIVLGCLANIGMELRPLVSKKLVKFHSVELNFKADILQFTDQGDLLCYVKREGQVMILDIHCKKKKVTFSVEGLNVISVAQYKDQVFVASFERDKLRCDMFASGKITTICELQSKPPTNQIMMVCDNQIFLMQHTSYFDSVLRVFDINGKNIRNISLPTQALSIYKLPEKNALITNINSFIAKYDITNRTAVRVSKSSNTYDYVCTDSTGICYGLASAWSSSVSIIERHSGNLYSGTTVGDLCVEVLWGLGFSHPYL